MPNRPRDPYCIHKAFSSCYLNKGCTYFPCYKKLEKNQAVKYTCIKLPSNTYKMTVRIVEIKEEV